MSLLNNSPTFSYISATGISVVYKDKLYTVYDFNTNKMFIYWNVETPSVFRASNERPDVFPGQYIVLINENGTAIEVPNEDIQVFFDGNSVENIKDRIFGIYEENKEFGDRFTTIEQNIEGVQTSVGEVQEDNNQLHEEVGKISQKADSIDLEVKDTVKKYNKDKESNKLREELNSSIIKLNADLGIFKSEINEYFKNNEISADEKIKIDAHIEILNNSKTTVMGHVDKVIAIAINNNLNEDKIALESAKERLNSTHSNLVDNISNVVSDMVITPSDRTIITDSFAKYSLRVNELKNTCDNIVFLGIGGVIIEELARIGIKSNEIVLSVEGKVDSDTLISSINMSKENIKINSSKIDITGLVTFSDLESAGKTIINGSNIKSGTINISDDLKLKGTGNRYISMEKDNYAVYDGGSDDANRKLVLGFRTVHGGYVPSLMLGYNGTGLHNDTTGSTCVTLTHYPTTNNPENVKESYGSLATRVNTSGNYSALNMYQGGRLKLRSHKYQEFYVEDNLKRMQIGKSQIGFYFNDSNNPKVVIDEEGVKVDGKNVSTSVAVFG